MKHTTYLPKITTLCAAILFMLPGFGSNVERLGGFDFSYETRGDERVRPVQVFDNGKYTYFQFRSGEAIPAIFADTSTGPSFLLPEFEGPYIKVPTVAGGYTLKLGYGVSRVVYQGGGRVAAGQSSMPPVASTGSLNRLNAAANTVTASYQVPQAPAQISTETNSYATPIKGDLVEWREKGTPSKDVQIMFPLGQAKLGPTGLKTILASLPAQRTNITFEIVGRDDDTYKEGLPEARAAAVAELLVSRGVPRESIKFRSGVPVASEANSKVVTGVTMRWVTDAPVKSTQDPTQATLAKLMARKISPEEAIRELNAAKGQDFGQKNTPAAVAPTKWEILKSDATLESMLRRWALISGSGWRVEWKDAPEVKITTDSRIERSDFISAADSVITQARAVGYRISASAYSNKVLVIAEDKSK